MTLDPPKASAVSELKFSNKGFHLAASWKENNICRVYSMHKQNQFADVVMSDSSEVKSICFDYYGQYLGVSNDKDIQIFYFRDFSAPLATIGEKANFVMFDTLCNLVAADGNKLKFISQAK